MKNLNFLSNLCGLGRASQSSDVGSRCRVGAVSLPSFCRVNMLKLVSVLVILLTIGSGNVWADSQSFNKSNFTSSASSTKTPITVTFSTTPTINNQQIRFSSGTKVTFTSSSGNITSIAVSTNSSNAYIKDMGKTVSSGTWSGSGTSYSWSGDASSITMTAGAACRITTMTVTYSAASCTSNPTVSAGSNSSVTATTATVSCSGISSLGSAGCSINSYGFVLNTTGTPTISDTKHQVGTTYTTTGTSFSKDLTGLSAETTYYVRPYATNGNGTAYGTQTSFTTPALPKYTVTLMDDGDTRTQASAGAGVTLPSRAGCTGYTFAGWTKTWVAPQSSWTTTAPTIIPAGSYTPSANENLYPVYTKTEGGGSPEFSQYQQVALGGTITAGKYLISTGSYTMAGNGKTGVSLTPGTTEAAAREYTVAIVSGTTITIKGPDNKYIGGLDKADGLTFSTTTPSSDDYRWVYTENGIQNKSITGRHIKAYSTTDFRHYGTGNGTLTYFYKRIETSGSTTSYISVPNCCTDPGLNYGTGSVTKTYGADAFTNTLTNSHSVAVTYSSSDPTVATVNGSGQVTILKAGSTTITASSAAQTVAAVSYCADEASYTLTVNKANISPTLTYTPNSVAAGSNTSAPTVGGNTGGGGVTYAITSATPSGCATINTSTGVVTGVVVGSVTVTATVAATTNYNGGTATANVTITAASGYCISAFNSSNNGITSGFSNGGSGNEYTLNYTIPGKDGSSNWPQYWIGENEAYQSFSASANFADMHFTHSDATLGLAEGATGKLHIWDDNKASGSNLWVKFEPDGYGLRWGGAGEWDQAANTKAFTVDAGDANVYWTDIVTLDGTNNTTWNYYVGLQTASGYVYSGVDNEASDSRGISRTRSVTAMKVSNGTAGSWKGTYLSSEPTGSRGKFRIWNNNIDDYNFYCHWVPFYRVTYDGSGASGSTAASADVCCEGNAAARTVVAAANGFTVPTGKTFGGWASSPENAAAGVVAYAAGANVVLTSSITLYAIWTDINYTVTVNQNPSVGATTTGQTTTAHYNGTINLTTTVPSGYRFVNWTTSDGFSITNPTSATTASFTMPNKSVTVTANFQQTHKVDWYVGGSAPANKIGDDGQTTVVDHGGKIEDFPATTPDGSACDKTFVGWTNTSSYVHGTSPLFNDVAGSPTINADASFYAVFATESGTPITWSQITDATNVTAGTYVIVASTSTQTGYLPTATASSSGPLFTTSGLTIADGKITSTVTDAMKWTFSAGSWDDENKYMEGISITNQDATPLKLYNISDKNNGVRVNSPSDQTWTIGNHESGTADVLYMWCNGRYCGVYNNADWRSYTTYDANNYEADAGSSKIKLFKQTGGTTYTGYTINCTSCANSVTVSYSDPGSGNTMAVTKGSTPIASGTSVKTCSAQSLTVTLTPATTHYTVTNFAATGVAGVTTTNVGNVYTINIPANATGTLTLTPTFTEDAHVAINWNVNGVNQSIAATEGLTWVYSGGDLTALPSTPSVPAGCSGTKVFAGWSQKHSDATEQDAAWYDDLFDAYDDPTVPTGITSAKTFYAVFATSSANPLAGEVMWDEPWTGTSDKTAPTSPSSGATVYNSTSLTYAYTNGNTTTQVYADGTMYSGGAAAPELLISKTSPSGVWTVTNIPTGGSAQTELTLSYKTNKTTIAVTSGTSGITIGDATVDGNTYTHTITISHSPSTINNFSLIFTNTGSANARIDDIHLVVPGSGTMTDYVTLCAPSWTITYDKNTSDPVTNLPSPTSVLQSTGSGTLSSTVPVRATYTFTGWAETTSGAVAYAAGGSITGVTGDKTLYAVWTKTPVEELFLNYSELNKYVGDPAVTLEVTGVTPEGADATVTWSSNNSTVASVVAATGVVTFGTVGTATITATSTVTGTTTAYCYVTVRNKPTASFTDLIHDGNGTDLSTYHMQNVAGTAIVFPTLDDYATPGDDCDSKHYIFVGWTTSDNNGDPEDHLVTSDELEDDQDKVFYAVWADGVEGVSYTKLTSNSFETGSTRYVIGVESGGDTYYLYDCASTDANNSWGYTTNAPGTNAPIQFSLSGTASALVVTSTEATARYLTPLTAKNFQMSATSKTVQLDADGTIHNTGDNSGWNLRGNTTDLRWYNGTTGTSAYFYKITAGAAVSYRTSCCTNNVPAPTVVATNTAYTVTLTWAAVVGATGYEVSWNGGAFTAATSPCVKSGLTASTDYTYKVRATYDPLVKCGALVASGNVTTDDVYTVTYSGGTGTGSCSPSGSVAPASYEAGATVTLAPTNSFSLTSNTFAAWVVKDADDNDVPVSNNQFTMPAKNVTVTATWTAVQDKYYDRMHDGTDGSHGGVQDGEGKYYLVREGCNYTVPTLTDDYDGDTDCHTTHYKLLGWIAQSHLKTDGSGQIKPDEESYIFQGGGTKSATGATYYAIWAIMTE